MAAAGRTGIGVEAAALRVLGIRSPYQRAVHARPDDRAPRVVDDEPRLDNGEPIEGPATAAERGGHGLIPNELDVMMS